MQTDFWKQVEELFQAALAEPPEKRDEFLEQSCPGDPRIRSEVQSLLNQVPAAGSFLADAPISSMVERRYALTSGQRLGNFEILESIGRGGMGEVYHARDLRLRREIAIKVLVRGVTEWDQRRFLREARAASALNHPNVVTVHDVGDIDGLSYIAMEFVPGKTLADLIPPDGMRPADEALRIAAQIADAVAAAHAVGVVHRDLKPGNVMVTGTGAVKVLDFGLAKRSSATDPHLRQSTTEPRTGPGLILGTAAYMSPEQAEGKAVDVRTDIFSLGAVLYEMLAGKQAFGRDSTASTIAAILKEDPPPLTEIVPNMPLDLERIVRRSLRKEKDRRFQAMADVKVELEELIAERSQNKATRRRTLSVSVALAIVLAVAAAWSYRTHFLPSQPAVQKTQLTAYAGMVDSPSFSPDGNEITFAWNGEKQDNFDIYVKFTDAPTAVRLTTDPAPDVRPAWSPDGRSIAFLRQAASAATTLMLMPAIGGPERPLGEARAGTRIGWSPDAKWVAVGAPDSGGGPPAIFLVSAATGERRRLTAPPFGSEGDSNPSFAPDGRALSFTRYASNATVGIYVLGLSSSLAPAGEPRRLPQFVNEYEPGTDSVWTRDGRTLVCTGLEKVDVSGSGKTEIHDAAGWAPAISAKGDRLAYVEETLDSNIWRLVLPDGGQTAVPQPFISTSAIEHNPQYSPDGRRVAFNKQPGIWVSDADGTNAIAVTTRGGGTPRWSPDGQHIAFDENVNQNFDIYTVPSNGGPLQRITTEASDEVIPSYSRDGKWIYFASNRTGRYEVWKVPASGGSAIQVTRNGGHVAFESTEGRYLYYTKNPGPGLTGDSPVWRMSVSGGEEVVVIPSVHTRSFDVTEKGIFFIVKSEVRKDISLRFYGFADQTTRVIIPINRPTLWGLGVSRDGRSILWAQHDVIRGNLMMLENFH